MKEIGMPARFFVLSQPVQPKIVQAAKFLRTNQTPAERLLWQHLRANRLNGWHFRRQQIIEPFIVDFYCHKAGLVIELDGGYHDDSDQQAYDQERGQALTARGLQVMRIPNERIATDMETVLEEILQACASTAPSSLAVSERGPLPPVPSPEREGGESSP